MNWLKHLGAFCPTLLLRFFIASIQMGRLTERRLHTEVWSRPYVWLQRNFHSLAKKIKPFPTYLRWVRLRGLPIISVSIWESELPLQKPERTFLRIFLK